jgi:hypothetical protein
MTREELREWIQEINRKPLPTTNWMLVDPREEYTAGPINSPLFWAIVWDREAEYMEMCQKSWKKEESEK